MKKRSAIGEATLNSMRSPEDIFFEEPENNKCCAPNCMEERDDEFPSMRICIGHAAGVIADFNRRSIYLAYERAQEREREAAMQPPEDHVVKRRKQEQVYYVRLDSDLIKIGYSAYIADRIASFRVSINNLLATEPGGLRLEKERHRQFAAERVNGQLEEFHHSPRLQAHMEKLRRTHDTVLTRRIITSPFVVIPRVI